MADKKRGLLYGNRPDGSPKGTGWLGELKSTDGQSVSTELTIGINFDNQERDIPLLVPTLTKEEAQFLTDGGRATGEIVEKAIQHAKKRIQAKKSPYKD